MAEHRPVRVPASPRRLGLLGALLTPAGYEADAARAAHTARLTGASVLLANHGAPTGGWCTAGRSGAWGPVGRGPHLDAAGSAPGAGVLVVPVGHDAVWHFLSTKAYWGGWLSRSDVDAQVTGAWRVVSAHTDGAVVGFARAVSDGVAVAYLADVFVAESVRGCGVAKAMLALMLDAGPGADFRWMLHTMDAHGLYRQLGFTEPTDRYLERSPRRS